MLRDSRRSEALPAAPVSAEWLVSPRADFWVLSAGGGLLLIALALVLHWHGDRELGRADVLLGELHLGATYAAIVRRRLWRRMPSDVLAVPLLIVGATYLLMLDERALLVTTTAVLYLGAWHRGRQGLGIARHYQRHAGGPVASLHRWLLQAAFYLPMVAAVAYYTCTAPTHEGEPFYGLALGPEILWALGVTAAVSVAAYLLWTRGRTGVHPGERALVVAHGAGFGSAYVLGAWTASFVLVLAIHHEVQYLYFTYALARRADPAAGHGWIREARRLARFAIWPAIGLASWALCVWSELPLLEPFLTAGLLAHYWLDGRIWTARARRLAAR
jgi:hypothetical protein